MAEVIRTAALQDRKSTAVVTAAEIAAVDRFRDAVAAMAVAAAGKGSRFRHLSRYFASRLRSSNIECLPVRREDRNAFLSRSPSRFGGSRLRNSKFGDSSSNRLIACLRVRRKRWNASSRPIIRRRFIRSGVVVTGMVDGNVKRDKSSLHGATVAASYLLDRSAVPRFMSVMR